MCFGILIENLMKVLNANPTYDFPGFLVVTLSPHPRQDETRSHVRVVVVVVEPVFSPLLLLSSCPHPTSFVTSLFLFVRVPLLKLLLQIQ